MSLQAHLRPYRGTLVHVPQLLVLALIGLTTTSVWVRWLVLVLVLLHLDLRFRPLLASWVFRIPAVVVDHTGVRLPLLRLHVGWDRIVAIRAYDQRAYGLQHPTIELVLTEPESLIRTARWGERGLLRRDLRSRGTPVVIRFVTLDQPMEPFLAEIRRQTGLAVEPEPRAIVPPPYLPPPPPGA